MLKSASLHRTPGPQPTTVDLPTKLPKNDSLILPLPINLAGPPSPALTSYAQRSTHVSRVAVISGTDSLRDIAWKKENIFVCCHSCWLRICKSCVGLLWKCGNGMKGILGEWLRLGVWEGLD